ncbi:STAS domain-containing protein [Actinomycetospora chiangmaiensis]|uniref:STAS domain-containing protein n=1 Tax=Actinomycetospora chiangmaiensis TaxID=402650 RepID=UPI00035F461B|nr:STAS domain-containing protein [Actinomycetospora chiangmaiensis]
MKTDDGRSPRRADHARPPVTETAGGVRLLRARPVVDAAAAAELRRECRGLLARSAAPVVVDLTAVRDVDPDAAAGVLCELAYEAGDADVDLRVVRGRRASAATRTLLDDETLFELYPTLTAALRHPGRPAVGGC